MHLTNVCVLHSATKQQWQQPAGGDSTPLLSVAQTSWWKIKIGKSRVQEKPKVNGRNLAVSDIKKNENEAQRTS